MHAHSEAYGNCGNVSRYSSRGNENWQRSGHVRLSDTSLADRPSGVLFVGRRRVQRLELNVITGGIDLLDGSRPISRPVTSVIAIIDPLASAAGVDDLVAPFLARDICICHGTECPAACNAPYVDEQRVEQTCPPRP